jgi:Putative Actinobacterial Holin-X, holin superfamily III
MKFKAQARGESMSSAEQTQMPLLPKLLHDLFHDAETLLFQQVALLRAELSEAIVQLLRGSVLVLIGLEIGVAGLVMLIAALVIAVSQVVPLWFACILVGAVTLGAALILVAVGRRKIASAGFAPRRTERAWRQTREWFEDELT